MIRNNLVCYRNNNDENEGRICLFNPSTYSVEEITKFHNYYFSYQLATTQNKVNIFVILINFSDFRFLELTVIKSHLKYMTGMLDNSQEVLLTNP